MFKRKIENVLNEYYDNPQDPIIIIDGARTNREKLHY